jgi:Ni/Fe-hydrogenase subunit HybB-like protein
VTTGVAAALAAAYTAWLFHQSRGRVLWMRRTLALELLVHAVRAGSALLLLLASPLALAAPSVEVLRWGLAVSLAGHFALILLEGRYAPQGRRDEYARARRLVTHGPYALRHWGLGVIAGAAVPLLLLLPDAQALWNGAALLALLGLYSEQDVLVRAGQALVIS